LRLGADGLAATGAAETGNNSSAMTFSTRDIPRGGYNVAAAPKRSDGFSSLH
jgi:hypothetical protein